LNFVKRFNLHLRRYLDRPMVRPLALAGPVLVLLIALPMLRPLRRPTEISGDEILRLATIRALVEHHSLSLDRVYARVPGAVETTSGIYSSQPPMMSVLLSAPAWVLNRMGIWFGDKQILISYLLTVLGVTLPVAGAAGLIYRMGRLFELRRPWRTALGIAVIAGSGLLSYSVVLNQYAPAGVLVLCSAACLIHVAAMNRDDRRAGWFALGGGCAALAATIDPAAAVFLVLFLFVIPTMRFSPSRRAAGIVLYILGAIPLIALHAAWNIPVTGDIIPASIQPMFHGSPMPVAVAKDDFDDDSPPQNFLTSTAANIVWMMTAIVGEHGVLSHFPVMIVALLGIGAVMHRHWPSSTKTLAGATVVGAVAIILLCRIARIDWSAAMFAAKWFIIFTPILLFWGGAWLRRTHSRASWIMASVALFFSVSVGIIGATDPTPPHGYDRYTAAGALARLTQPKDAGVRGALARREQ
jgi:hypothetical protein